MNMKRILMVLAAFLALLICATSAFAQRPESLQENMLLSAVKKYNEVIMMPPVPL